jgi:regulator of sigma E protease
LASTVGSVTAEFPAQAAGIQPGDLIVSINGQAVTLWDEVAPVIHEQTSGEPVVLDIERSGQRLRVAVTPRLVEERNLFGDPVTIGLIGITPGQDVTWVRYGVAESMRRGIAKVGEITVVTLQAFGRMLTGRMSLKESLHGPIGIFKYTGDAARLGMSALLQMMALLSVSLAIINVFPIPVLDGGHLLFLAIEKIRGRPLSVRTQEHATRAGLLLLILLMVFTVYNDLMRFKLVEQAVEWWGRR